MNELLDAVTSDLLSAVATIREGGRLPVELEVSLCLRGEIVNRILDLDVERSDEDRRALARAACAVEDFACAIA